MTTDSLGNGPTSHAVRENVRRLREEASFSYAELSRRLTAVGHPLAVLALRRIEDGERRVTVDDLTALAVVLGVNPDALLRPSAEDVVQLTGTAARTPGEISFWLQGLEPLKDQEEVLYERLWGEGGKSTAKLVAADIRNATQLTQEEIDTRVERFVFHSLTSFPGSIASLYSLMQEVSGPAYVSDAEGETLFRVPEDAPDPYWSPESLAAHEAEPWRGHVLQELKRLIGSVEDLHEVIDLKYRTVATGPIRGATERSDDHGDD